MRKGRVLNVRVCNIHVQNFNGLYCNSKYHFTKKLPLIGAKGLEDLYLEVSLIENGTVSCWIQ